MGKLILARHHESEWNKLGLWTGTRDRHLTPYGFKKSEEMGELLKGILKGAHVGRAFASMQVRAIETLSCMLNAIGEYNVPHEYSKSLNERDYGDYTGKDKWQMQKLIGQARWNELRRNWDYPMPGGETLRMVYERAVPYFLESILPFIKAGETVLIVAHGNSCRALIKYIEKIHNEKIQEIEMPFGGIFIYELDDSGRSIKKEILSVKSEINA